MNEYKRPLPNITPLEKEFWDSAKRHELFIYQCKKCGTFYNPVTHCTKCQDPEMDWSRVSGKGEVYTFIIYHMPFHPAWKDHVPYNVSWVKLDEGPLLMSNIVSCKNEDIHVGMRVEVCFDDITEDITMPKFKPVS